MIKADNSRVYSAIALFSIMGSSYLVKIPVIIQMLSASSIIIWLGSNLSLEQRLSDAKNEKKTVEIISPEDAYKSPFTASFSLLSLYVAMKYFSKEWVNYVINLTIIFISSTSILNFVSTILIINNPSWKLTKYQGTFKLNKFFTWIFGQEKIDYDFCFANCASGIIGFLVSIAWFKTQNWYLHNVLATFLSIHAIQFISVGTFKTASVLLSGLFFYDIFWVFRTEVMVTVAKSFDAPVKLAFPLTNGKYSLLGLGDIIVPGIFIAMSLKFDHYMSEIKKKNAHEKNIYFICCMVAYVISLLFTGIVMIFWGRAQPALLYLVPSLFVGFYGAAAIRGELPDIFEYSEEVEESEDEEEYDSDSDIDSDINTNNNDDDYDDSNSNTPLKDIGSKTQELRHRRHTTE